MDPPLIVDLVHINVRVFQQLSNNLLVLPKNCLQCEVSVKSLKNACHLCKGGHLVTVLVDTNVLVTEQDLNHLWVAASHCCENRRDGPLLIHVRVLVVQDRLDKLTCIKMSTQLPITTNMNNMSVNS